MSDWAGQRKCANWAIEGSRLLLAFVMLSLLIGHTGCTRLFYREKADHEAENIIKSKDHAPNAKVEQFHVYPDPRARFADPTKPDRPPMPPDDPYTASVCPNPQHPGKAGIAYIEG